jgi:hypothetical protein
MGENPLVHVISSSEAKLRSSAQSGKISIASLALSIESEFLTVSQVAGLIAQNKHPSELVQSRSATIFDNWHLKNHERK